MVSHGWRRAAIEKQRVSCRAWDNQPKAGSVPQQSLGYQQLPLSMLEKLGESMACKAGGSWPQDHAILRRKSWMRRC